MANVLYTCLEKVQTELRDNVTLTSLDSEVLSIPDANIVIRKLGLREREFEAGHLLTEMPGILIVPGPAQSPPSAGTASHDDVMYTIDVVICDRDNEQRLAGLNTYTQWMQSIRQRLNLPTIAWPSDAASGIVWQVNVVNADAVNDWRWVKHREAVTGVQLRLISREPRG
jgi:hypothetical protein